MVQPSGRRRVAIVGLALVAGSGAGGQHSFVVEAPTGWRTHSARHFLSARRQVEATSVLAGSLYRRPGPAAFRGRTARRLFDSGSFFGVGVPEALVIALLGWFLLGPEELYKISKKVGGWLGELRTYIGQAARQYESALDDKSTRQAIEGLRQTQQTVSELAGSWRSVTDSLRDPLAISSTLQSTFDKYSPKPQVPPPKLDDKTEANSKRKEDEEEKEKNRSSSEESEEELEAKRAKSREAVSDMWYKSQDGKDNDDKPWQLPKAAESFLARLDDRLDEIESLAPELDAVQTAATRLEELRKGVLEDRAAIREIVLQSVEKKV